jgi:hypothetical protein
VRSDESHRMSNLVCGRQDVRHEMSGVVNHRPRWPDGAFASASSKKALFLG